MLTRITEKLAQLKEGMGGKQFLALLMVLVILFAIPLTVYLVKQRQEIRSKASGRTLSLVFRGAPPSVGSGNTFSADVVLQGSSQSTYTGVDVTITYPADKVTLVSFTPPSSPALNEEIWRDPNPLVNTGSFRYIAVNKGNPSPASFITLGTLTFKMTATTGDAQLNFGGTSQAVVLEEVEPFLATNTSASGQQLAVSPVTVAVAAGPVAGGWTDWSACSVTACGSTGTQTRTCTEPAPANGGATCSGASSQACSTPACGLISGDADGNSCVDNADRLQWVKERNGDCHRCTNWSGETAPKRNIGLDYTYWYTAFASKPSLCATATVPNCTTIACQ
ncbi:hypothetical protein A3A14_00720 [Candidatus Daviesbacteria bacterium RIFCSPLOWO2_01_FULL_43_38]|uniref:Cohesin domain-containing protein n=1 Tax=Candidatus Daviesbacteria bacterium RIFCSPHIGHO2_12_FULL_43_11 TaxID=1797780 RepID=A0A1F5K2J9_9BACT|nr:MAG: hypothetical protein A2874_01420 [Candidatus Daviesbacteria bacterium RIFCSPHIGHO2_01_FULL_43_17]OGE35123.1 MAG: hypothetical protein A3E45_03280 [Candidatus Daviesbacteria bacterium RIFCSPHIGHO2_12_FULL_43_11]OGE63262.1 MAG: hypothetical protein A3A14_00720 [Candidatus Daviesbacteria bacterium RIFCSPLOWO2_01_FULL_43_38]